MPRILIDSFTEEGCRELCRRINRYWAKKGVVANARVEKERVELSWGKSRTSLAFWAIRSDIGLYEPEKVKGVAPA